MSMALLGMLLGLARRVFGVRPRPVRVLFAVFFFFSLWRLTETCLVKAGRMSGNRWGRGGEERRGERRGGPDVLQTLLLQDRQVWLVWVLLRAGLGKMVTLFPRNSALREQPKPRAQHCLIKLRRRE